MFAAMRQLVCNIAEQLHRRWPTLLLVYVPPTIFLLVLTLQRDVPAHDLMADTASIANVPTYIGLVSNLGIILWGATVTICVFTMVLLGRQSTWISFFAGSAGLTLLLLLDDKFMIHDRVLPHNNIPEPVYVVFYGLVCLAYAIAFWRFFRQTDYVLLLIAVVLLGFSVAVDVAGGRIQDIYYALRGSDRAVVDAPEMDEDVEELFSSDEDERDTTSLVAPSAEAHDGWIPSGNLSQLAEDGTKFLGIIGWLLYFASVARQRILYHVNARMPLKPVTRISLDR